PLKVDPADYKLEFENPQVRVTRVKIGAHKKVPEHEHVLNRVVVYLTDQNGSMTTPDGKTDTAQHHAGEVSWGGPVKHREENLMDNPFEAVVVEFKCPAAPLSHSRHPLWSALPIGYPRTKVSAGLSVQICSISFRARSPTC